MKAISAFFVVSIYGALPTVAAVPETNDPFSSPASVRVLLFVRTDCPLTNRYAPEIQRLSKEFAARSVKFWLVYPDPSETNQTIEAHMAKYGFPGTPTRDTDNKLVRRSKAIVAPEAAVFDGSGRLLYHGRIDNRWVEFGLARPAATIHDLEDAIEHVLAKKPVSNAETRAVGCALADLH